MSLLNKVSMFTLPVLLASCASITAPEKVAHKNANYELYAKHALAYQELTPNVYNFKTYYVPKLEQADLKMPDWVNSSVGRRLGDKVELGLLLNLVLGSKRLNVEYREGVDKSLLININSHTSTIKDLLNAIQASSGYKLDVRESGLVVHKFMTKIFPVRTPVGLYEFAIGKRKEGKLDTDSDDFAQSEALTETGDEFAVLSGEFDPLNDYLKGVESILSCKSNEELNRIKSSQSDSTITSTSDDSEQSKLLLNSINQCESGASAKIIKSDSSIFVKALPSQMLEVEKFIAEKTERELRQVRINLTLVAIEKNKDTALNFDADIIDKTLAGINKLSLETISKSSTAIIGGLGERGSVAVNHVNGTSLVLQNLAKQGSILDKTFMTAVTSNNRIGKFTDASKVSLITDRPVNQTTNVGTQSGVEQKVVNSGRVFYMLPNIGESDVVLSVSTSLSSLKDIVQKGDPGSEVESPEISDREINTTIRLEPNKPKIIGGFSIDESQSLFSHTGLTGLGRSSRDREVHVVMVAEAMME